MPLAQRPTGFLQPLTTNSAIKLLTAGAATTSTQPDLSEHVGLNLSFQNRVLTEPHREYHHTLSNWLLSVIGKEVSFFQVISSISLMERILQ